jgi:hypothetical protein
MAIPDFVTVPAESTVAVKLAPPGPVPASMYLEIDLEVPGSRFQTPGHPVLDRDGYSASLPGETEQVAGRKCKRNQERNEQVAQTHEILL